MTTPPDYCVNMGELSTSPSFRFNNQYYRVTRVQIADKLFRRIELEFSGLGPLPPGNYRLYVSRHGYYDLHNEFGFYVGDRDAPTFNQISTYRLRLVEVVPAEISVAAFNTSIREGEIALFRVQANGHLPYDLDVRLRVTAVGDFGIDGAAPAGGPSPLDGTGNLAYTHIVRIPRGSNHAYFRLPTTDDEADEANGAVRAQVLPNPLVIAAGLPLPSYAVVGQDSDPPDPSKATIRIADNDPGPASESTVRLTGPASITEGDNAVFTITANPAPARDLPVRLRTDPLGNFGAPSQNVVLTIPGGQTQVTHTVPTINDTTDEPNGMLTGQLSCVWGGDCVPDFAHDLVRIGIMDDDGSGPVLRVNVKDVSFDSLHRITEGETARFVITTDPPGEWVTHGNSGGVNYRLTITGGNFNARDVANNRLPFTRVTEVGGGALGVNIYTTDDNVDEPDGRVTLTLLPHTGSCTNTPCTTRGYQLPSDPHQVQAILLITDNDGPPTRTPITRLGELPGESRLRVEWEAVPEATGYEVHWGAAGQTARQTAHVTEPVYTTPELSPGVAHAFQVAACNNAGCGEQSPQVQGSVALPQPTAKAGPDLTGAPGESVTLQGKGSANPYGRWHQMDYQWTQLSGPPVTLTHPRDSRQAANKFADPSFTVPEDAADGATLEFQLTVTDQEGQSDSDTVIVTVAAPEVVRPTATAGPDLTGAPGESVTLQGKGSVNPYGRWHQMAHQWTQLSGPPVTLTHPRTSQPAGKFADPSFTIPADAAGGTTLEFQLTVTDKESQSDSDTMIVTVTGSEPAPEPANTPPTAAIDAAQVTAAEAGETVRLQGVGNDAETAAESLTFAWSQVGGTPTFSIASATTATATFTAPDVTEQTSLTFRLTVTDEGGLSATAETTVAIIPPPEPENTPPTFDEGDSAERSLAENSPAGTSVGSPVTATDPDDDILTYSLSGADADAFEIDAATGQLTTREGVTYDYETKSTYAVTVTAEDPEGASASISVTVSLTDVEEAAPNNAPVFDEGTETTRTLAENAAGGENVGLPLTATDQDQDTLTYSLSGADAGSFDLNAATGQLTTIDGITYDYEAKPTYSVTLEADDGNGGTATIDVTVSLTDVEEATPVTTCFTQLGMLSAAGDYAGAWDDADCKAHHQDSRGRYFQFTLTEETTVQISLSAGALYVSKDTPKNGWGSVPGPGYEHRRNVRRDNGKLVHDGSNTVTLTLEAGETYTVEAAGDGGGTFTLSVTPTEE